MKKEESNLSLVIKLATKMDISIFCHFCKQLIAGKEFRKHIKGHQCKPKT